MNKNQKVLLFRVFCKIFYVFLITTLIFWLSWDSLCVERLGIGNEIMFREAWIFGLPVLLIFYCMRFLNPYWFIHLRVSDFTIYSVLILGWLGLLAL